MNKAFGVARSVDYNLECARENLYEAELRGDSEARLRVLRAEVRQAERRVEEIAED